MNLRVNHSVMKTNLSKAGPAAWAQAVCPHCGHLNYAAADQFGVRVAYCDVDDGGCDRPYLVDVTPIEQRAIVRTGLALQDFDQPDPARAHLHPFVAVWEVAMTLANNLAARVSDQFNDDDRTVEATAVGEAVKSIRAWLNPGTSMEVMLREGGVPEHYIAQLPPEYREPPDPVVGVDLAAGPSQSGLLTVRDGQVVDASFDPAIDGPVITDPNTIRSTIEADERVAEERARGLTELLVGGQP